MRDNYITYTQRFLAEKINKGKSRLIASARRDSSCVIHIVQNVKIRLGRSTTCAIIIEVIKDNFRGQTQSGIIVTVSVSNLQL